MSHVGRSKKYIAWVLGGTLIIMLLVISMNYLVDPYGYFGTKRISGLNQSKVAQNRHMRLVKARLIQENTTDRIVIGSSRAMAFIPGFSGDSREFLNLALAGSGVIEHLAYLRYADTNQGIKEVLYPVDFFAFHASLREVPGFSYERLDPSGTGRIGKYLKTDLVEMLVSLNATIASFETIKANISQKPAAKQKTGIDVLTNRINKNAFSQMETTFLTNLWFRPPLNKYTTATEHYDSLQTFRQLVSYLAEQGITANFIIPPIHVRLQLALLAAGLRGEYDDWVIGMTKVIEEVTSEHPHWEGTLWNFGGVNPVTIEEVPENSREMRNYVDSSHFSKTIAAVIYQTVSSHKPGIEGFGQSVHLDSVRVLLSKEQSDLETYARDNPALWADVNELSLRAEKARSRYMVK